MGENTKIQWAHHTFNPWRGCTKVAPGCANCYAETQSKRNPGTLGVWGPNGTRVVASEAMWRQPVKWDRVAASLPRQIVKPGSLPIEYIDVERLRVFCASLADVFEDWPNRVVQSDGSVMWHRSDIGLCSAGQTTVGGVRHERLATLDDVRARLFRLIDATPHLDWLLLTKRPENIRRMWQDIDRDTADMSTLLANHMRAVNARVAAGCVFNDPASEHVAYAAERDRIAHRPNVWLGTSIACQEDADRNIPELLNCRNLAAKLFLSIEPLVGPVDLGLDTYESPGLYDYRKNVIDWVIVGGESGPNARPCNIAWIRSIVRQCKDAGVPVFVKQLGANSLRTVYGGPAIVDGGIAVHSVSHEFKNKFTDPKGGDPSEWPEDLHVREVPS